MEELTEPWKPYRSLGECEIVFSLSHFLISVSHVAVYYMWALQEEK